MFRLTNNLKNLTLSIEELSANYTNLQTVRWQRKPRWLPVAKSKVFRIPKKPETPQEDNLELQRLFNNYRTQIKSLRRHFFYKHHIQFLASEDPEQQRIIFEKDLDRCNKINDKWNAEQKVLREKRAQENLEVELEFARKRIEVENIKREEHKQKTEEYVKKVKEESKEFITAENIDKAIEIALNNPVDYNYALTPSGEKIFGRENNEFEVKEKISVKQ
ncbi:unnamed protein product [Brassicogethes aeneus]|uniref:Small ribosomal subunit protein mS26 n=1 Tax=Brassicogethes aeneus TaxID=1431903 RepID=A0A9P0B9F0_BRAAE|nr:unnamed protein product [Brassicogethes aeneus]